MTTMNRWFCVLGGVLMNLSLGALYGWSLFVPALQRDLNVSREQASNIFSIAVAVFALCFLIGGRLQDKKGPYIVSLIGSVLFGLGFLLTSRAGSLTGMYLAFGAVVGIGSGFGYVTPIGVATKWFPDRRGLVVGISVGAFGAGSAILGPIVPGLIASYGWRPVMLWLGILYFVATMVGAQFLKNPPPGWTPPGWKPSTTSPSRATGVDYAPSEILGTTQFWRLLFAYALGASAGLMVISQLLPYAQQAMPGVGAALAGTAITIGAIGNACGRIFSGWLSDSIGRIKTLSLMVLISAIALPLLGRSHSLALLWPLLFVVYYCYGTQLSVYASTTADFFGAKNVGANYGLVFLAWGVAGVLGPKLGGRLYDQLQSYTRAFDIAAILLVIAFAIIVTLKPPQKKMAEVPAART
ncbi:MAG: OFA family MFS transporter [Acidobacteria bacterium]|nr:OFA family MFS transporter [Acidobacteriota bacterium]